MGRKKVKAKGCFTPSVTAGGRRDSWITNTVATINVGNHNNKKNVDIFFFYLCINEISLHFVCGGAAVVMCRHFFLLSVPFIVLEFFFSFWFFVWLSSWALLFGGKSRLGQRRELTWPKKRPLVKWQTRYK